MNLCEPALMRTGNGQAVPLVEVTGTARADGLLLQTTFLQRYANRSPDNIETVYTFPLPHGAVLLGLTFTLGERRLTGVVAERKEAEERYEEAIDDGHSAVLLERSADGLYTVSVGNLLAGEEATVEVRYGQLLSFVQGQVRIAIPTVIAPRYGDAIAAGLAPHAAPETDLGADYPARFVVELGGELANGTVACPSLAAVRRRVDERLVIELEGRLDRDFVVTIDGLAGRPLATIAQDGDGWVALASFLPTLRAPANEASLSLKVLVDCSGSMNGDSIEQARQAVARLLNRLSAPDRVSVSAFGSSVVHQREGLRVLDESHRGECLRWTQALRADLGGTEMHGALASLFEVGGEGGRDADVFLITDGEVWNTEEIIELARARDQRVFIVAVGSSPAESLLTRLAQETGGAAEFVTPKESIEDALMRLLGRLRQPRAKDVRVRWPVEPEWVGPVPPALFGGETLHAMARFEAQPEGNVILEWNGAEPDAVPLALPARQCAATDSEGALGRVAAGHTVLSLPEAKQASFALRYQLVTSQTSMVLMVERADAERTAALPVSVKVPHMMAAGWGGVGSSKFSNVAHLLAPTSPFVGTCDMAFDSSTHHFARRSQLHHGRNPITALARLVNKQWRMLQTIPASISDLSWVLSEEWLEPIRECAAKAGETESVLVAWLIVQSAGISELKFDRRALREARRVAASVPAVTAEELRATLPSPIGRRFYLPVTDKD